MTDLRYIAVRRWRRDGSESVQNHLYGRAESALADNRATDPAIATTRILRVDLDDLLPHDASPEDEWAFRESRMLCDAQWCMERRPGVELRTVRAVEDSAWQKLQAAYTRWMESPLKDGDAPLISALVDVGLYSEAPVASAPVTVSEPSFFRVSPDPSDPGWRIRVERAPGELTTLVEEQVLPERVNKRANRVIDTRTDMWLTAKDLRWLHGVFGELIRELDVEDPAVSEQTPGYGDNDDIVRSRRADRSQQPLCGEHIGLTGEACVLDSGHEGAHAPDAGRTVRK